MTWLMETLRLQDRQQATQIGQTLMDHGMLHHVTNDHPFKEETLFYRLQIGIRFHGLRGLLGPPAAGGAGVRVHVESP